MTCIYLLVCSLNAALLKSHLPRTPVCRCFTLTTQQITMALGADLLPTVHADNDTTKTNIAVFSLGLIVVYVLTKIDLHFERISSGLAGRMLRRLYIQISVALYVYWVLIRLWLEATIQHRSIKCPFDTRHGHLPDRSTEAIKLIVDHGHQLLGLATGGKLVWEIIRICREGHIRPKPWWLLVLVGTLGVNWCFQRW